jgi:hypothetical protein
MAGGGSLAGPVAATAVYLVLAISGVAFVARRSQVA